MFCPKCGALLDQSGAEWKCAPGDMGLSRNVQRGIETLFDPGSPVIEPKPWSTRIGGRWFCPLDGRVMSEAEGVVACPVCGRSLNPLIYQLIELHRHRPYPKRRASGWRRWFSRSEG
jgi:hypothetical protein